MNRTRMIAAVGLMAGSMLLSSQVAEAASSPEALVGKKAPEFAVDLLDGGKFDLKEYRGKKVLILDFWATWCGPCRRAMPALTEIADEFKDKDVLYFAVDLQETPAKIRQYLKQADLKIQVPLDRTGQVARQYGVRGIPTMVVIDKNGIVRAAHVGFSPALKSTLVDELEKIIDSEKSS